MIYNSHLTRVALLFSSLLSLSVQIPSALAAESATAKGWILDASKGSGTVTFDAIGKPSMLKIHGKGDSPKGELKAVDGKFSGVISFKLDTLSTGISLRDKHMKERYLEVGKYPEAKITFSNVALPENFASDNFTAEKLPFKGTLSLHGVEKPIEGTAKLDRKGDSLSVDARFDFKTSDFNISSPTFMGVTMTDTVSAEVQTTAPFHVQ